MKQIIQVMILILLMQQGRAQLRSSNWLTVQLPVEISKHWQSLNEYSYRTIGESASLYQLFLRAGVRYVFNQKWNVSTSYDFVLTRTSAQKSNHEFGIESRIWQEVNNSIPLKNNYFLQNRIRVEERFFAATASKEAYTGLRFRYRLGCLKRFSPTWSLFVSNEYLEELEKQKFSFNQNRVFLNAICQLDHSIQLQAGYYYVIRPEREQQHIATITFQKRLSFHGRKQA